MMDKKYIILNFTHGNGPFLRTIELALAVNDLFEKKGLKRLGIIVPWVYGPRQKTIIQENFKKNIKKYPGEILLDKRLGGYLEHVFYGGEKTYEESLIYLLENHKNTEDKIKNYLSGGLSVEDFYGNEILVNKKDIVMEINRCPVVSFGIIPSYYTSFAYMSEIFERSLEEPNIIINKDILKKLIPYYFELERKQTIRFIAEPATFSYLTENRKRHDKEIYTPPNSNQSLNHHFFVRKGVYVTVTGITGINKRLFKELHKVGLKIYTNKPGLIPFSKKARPTIISHRNVFLHFARVGWGSAWLSWSTETPLIALPYDTKDDPEVYFNNICIEKIGLGKIYTGQPIEELLEFRNQYKENLKLINNELLNKYGTLNGVEYIAEKIFDHFIKL